MRNRLLIPLLLLAQVFPIGWLCGVWLCGAVCGDCTTKTAAPAAVACVCCGEGVTTDEACADETACCPVEPAAGACGGCEDSDPEHRGCVCVVCPGDDGPAPVRPVSESRPLLDLALVIGAKPAGHPTLTETRSGIGAPLIDFAGRFTAENGGLIRAWLCCWTT